MPKKSWGSLAQKRAQLKAAEASARKRRRRSLEDILKRKKRAAGSFSEVRAASVRIARGHDLSGHNRSDASKAAYRASGGEAKTIKLAGGSSSADRVYSTAKRLQLVAPRGKAGNKGKAGVSKRDNGVSTPDNYKKAFTGRDIGNDRPFSGKGLATLNASSKKRLEDEARSMSDAELKRALRKQDPSRYAGTSPVRKAVLEAELKRRESEPGRPFSGEGLRKLNANTEARARADAKEKFKTMSDAQLEELLRKSDPSKYVRRPGMYEVDELKKEIERRGMGRVDGYKIDKSGPKMGANVGVHGLPKPLSEMSMVELAKLRRDGTTPNTINRKIDAELRRRGNPNANLKSDFSNQTRELPKKQAGSLSDMTDRELIAHYRKLQDEQAKYRTSARSNEMRAVREHARSRGVDLHSSGGAASSKSPNLTSAQYDKMTPAQLRAHYNATIKTKADIDKLDALNAAAYDYLDDPELKKYLREKKLGKARRR